jgi:hypothetical protein
MKVLAPVLMAFAIACSGSDGTAPKAPPSAPASLPTVMPQSAAIAPRFTARYPEAAIIFDNLHSLHDVVSDVLADPSTPRAEKRRTILGAAARYRDSTTSITSVEEWKSMAESMGVANMGGPAPVTGGR